MIASAPSCGCGLHSGQHRLPRPSLHLGSRVEGFGRPHAPQAQPSSHALPGAAVQQRGCLQVVNASKGRGSLPKAARVPDGYVDYETMILLRPDLSEEDRDIELAKFEAFLERQQAQKISALVRGVTQLAYPIKGFWEGVYVLYTYTARRSTSVAVQGMLATPPVGEEKRVLRFGTFCV